MDVNGQQYQSQRTQAFGMGQQAGRSVDTPELNGDLHASVLTEAASSPDRPYTAQGVLSSLSRFSGNGMAAQDKSRQFMASQQQVPMPSMNGTAQPNQEAVTGLRILAG